MSPNIFEDKFAEGPLPELDIPPKEGWRSTVEESEYGPVWTVFRENSTEYFGLSNRSFEQLDYYMSYKLMALLIKKTKENPDRKIVILDVGGGALSECMRGMLRHPFLKGKIQCINVDIFAQPMFAEQLTAEGIDPSDLFISSADFLEADVMDNSVDIAWSYQVLDFMTDERKVDVLEKTARVLAPGGEAYHNESWKFTPMAGIFEWEVRPHLVQPQGFGVSSSFNAQKPQLQEIADAHDVCISPAFGETTLNGHTHLMGGSMSPFVYMGKSYQDGMPPGKMDLGLAFPEIIDAVKSYP